MTRSFLFVCGCPRSGTTALWRLLTSDQRLRLGVERYGNKFFSREFLTPDLFEKQRFFEVQSGDTFYSNLEAFNPYYKTAREGYENALYFGDKIPKLYNYFDRLGTNFPNCKTIFIFRNVFDVAASYKARLLNENDNWKLNTRDAVSDWNASLRAALSYQNDLFFVDYEELFIEHLGVEKLFGFLGLDVSDDTRAAFKNLTARSGTLEAGRARALTAIETKEICETADFSAYRELVQIAAA
jgi:hypothetical protein